MKIRDIENKDLDFLLNLNNNNTPAVSELDESGLRKLIEYSLYSWIIESSEEKCIAGFCIIIPPGENYASDNYLWVSNKYDDFHYLDRVVITNDFQGKGYGRKIYEQWFQHSQSKNLLLEVNIKPRNEDSILFHKKMGFSVVGEQDTENGKKRVQYMAKIIKR